MFLVAYVNHISWPIGINNRFTGVIAGSDPQSRKNREYEYNEECWQSHLVMRDAASKCGMKSLVSILPSYIFTRTGNILNWFMFSSGLSKLGNCGLKLSI
jgi:hypothetical protein